MKLILCGGGSREQTVEANKVFNGIIDHTKPLLYVPLAMDEIKRPYDGCLEWITEELSSVNIPSIEMVRTFEEFASKNYFDYCAIFIGGGNTFKLLKGIKDSGAFEKLREYINNDGIVYGGSAGAIIFGKDIEPIHIMDSNDAMLKDTLGFNVLDGRSLFAHYTNEKTPEIHERYKQYLSNYSSNNEDVIALPEEDSIYINGSVVEVIGSRPYFEFINGNELIQSKIKLVPYTDDDYEFVYEVKKNAYKKYVEECWGSWVEEDQRTYFDKFITAVKNNAYIIMDGNNKIGFYNGETLENGNYEVGNICIIPEYQGRGIGTKILKEKLEQYKDKDIEIQYFKQNPVGKLYERLGFIPNGETQFHYQMKKPKQDILVK